MSYLLLLQFKYVQNVYWSKSLHVCMNVSHAGLHCFFLFVFFEQKLKKRLLMMTMTLSDLKNPYAELQMEGAIEEIRKERKVYQKRWKLNFRCVWNMKMTMYSNDNGDISRNIMTLFTVLYYSVSINVFSYVCFFQQTTIQVSPSESHPTGDIHK